MGVPFKVYGVFINQTKKAVGVLNNFKRSNKIYFKPGSEVVGITYLLGSRVAYYSGTRLCINKSKTTSDGLKKPTTNQTAQTLKKCFG